MNIERAAMQGKLAEAEKKKKRLVLKAEGLCQSIRQQINTALSPVEEIEVALAAQQMDDLVMTFAELAAENGRIARLKKELG